MGYLIPMTALQRSRLKELLLEVKGADTALDAVLEQVEQADQVSDVEGRQRIGMETDEGVLDWDWIEQLRLEWSAAADEPWTTAEVLDVVMGNGRKALWQPRSA